MDSINHKYQYNGRAQTFSSGREDGFLNGINKAVFSKTNSLQLQGTSIFMFQTE